MNERTTSWPPEPAPEPGVPEYEPIHPGGGRGGRLRERAKRFLGPIGAGAILLATKGKALIVLLPRRRCWSRLAPTR